MRQHFVIFQLFSVIKAVGAEAFRCKALCVSQHPSLHDCLTRLDSKNTVYNCIRVYK